MSQTAVEANAITSQPLMANMPNISPSPDAAADVITIQPLMNEPTEEEQEEKRKRDNIDIDGDDCIWCCFTCVDCTNGCNCHGCDLGCDECCNDCCNDCTDCCTGCCADGDGGNIDGGDVVGCLECCGSCFECCND